MSNLAENIRKYRKSNHMTQEELAEKLGVKFGAISKWERGGSEPDVDYIMDMADIFHISVDVLLGYTMKGKNADIILERISQYIKDKNMVAAVSEADAALMKFPNDLRIVHVCAQTYLVQWSETKNIEMLNKAYQYFTHSLELLPSYNPEINELSIKNAMATCLLYLGENEKALEMFKKNNVLGTNNISIALLLADSFKNYKEAEAYIDKAYFKSITDILNELFIYALIFVRTDRKMCMKTCDFLENFLAVLKEKEGTVNLFDKYVPVGYMVKGICHIKMGEEAEGRALLSKAYMYAKRFDETPVNDMSNVVFARTIKDWSIYDSVETGSVNTLDSLLLKYFNPKEEEKINAIWSEIKKEKGLAMTIS